jgi:tetratricopeptide (TPR) repeat protein/TolB-like protein
MTLAAGTKLGPYEILAPIGAGGMGEVYRARDPRLGREVAIKVLPSSFSQDADRLRRFEQEARAAGVLNHPNITAVYDIGQHDGAPYVVQELLEGETLRSRLAPGPLTSRKATEYAVQIAQGLAAAHEKGIVHRDLKPENLFVTSEGHVKILDFGLAKTMSPASAEPGQSTADTAAATKPGLILGTTGYMSPEQVRGTAIDHRSDIFSFGVILYEMLSGERAFQRRSDIETLMAILKEEPPQLERPNRPVAPELADIVGHCLEKNPSERFQSARDLAFALRGADREGLLASSGSRSGVAAEGAGAIGSDSREEGVRPSARSDPRLELKRRFPRLLALALIAVATTGGVLFLWRGRPRLPPLAPAAAGRGRRSVAVLGFQNLSGREQDAWLSTALSEMVSAEAAAGGRVRTIEGEDVARMKADLGLAPTSSLSAESLSKIRNRSGADDVVVGSYLFLGSPAHGQIRLDVRVQDTRTGETVATITQMGDEPRLFDLVSRVGGTLREGLGEPRLSEEQSAAVRAALPLDPGAARLYAEGLEKLRSYDATAARDLLTKAVEAEPSSPLAHAALAQAWSHLGYDQRAVEEAQRAFDLSSGLPREQKLPIEARLAQAQKKWDEAATLYQTLWKSFPDELEYGLRVAQTQVAGGHARDGLATVDALRRLPLPQGEDPRIDLAEADAAGAVSDYSRERTAAVRAATKAGRLGARMILAEARIEEGSATDRLEGSARAKPKFEEARALYHQAGDRRGEASALRFLGGVRLGAGDNAAARGIYQQAWTTFREIGDRRGEAATLTDIINLDWLQAGNLTLVASELEQLRALYQDIGDQAGTAWALNGMGTVAWDQGDLQRSMDLHEQALAICRKIDKPAWEAWSLESIGDVLHSRGDLAAAQRAYEEAMAIREKVHDASGRAGTLNSLSGLLFDMGNLDKAQEAAREAMAIQSKLGENETRAATSLSLADVLMESGRAEEAVRLAREAGIQFQKSREAGNEALAQGTLVRALLTLGKNGEAQEAAIRARTLLRGTDLNEGLPAEIACARADAASGRGDQARKEVEAILRKAMRIGWVNFQLDARLALAEIDLNSVDAARGRTELQTLAGDASAKGFGNVARKARRLLGERG